MIAHLLIAAVCAANVPAENELLRALPEIFAKAAAHYKALDAAATPLMKDEKGESRTPHGWKKWKTGKDELDMRSIYGWTAGHFPGSLWYLYEATGDAFFKDRATAWTETIAPASKLTRNHDIGFIMYCSFGNAKRILGTDKYDALLLEAADTLTKRYNPKLGLIRSWGKIEDGKDFLVIPDNMMNLELLEAATKLGGEKRFADIARSHASVTMQHHFRPDGGTYHVLNYSQKDGRIQEIRRGQGAQVGTAWSRGQSWAIYGYTMMYRESGKREYLDFAQKVSDFAINHPNMPADGIPYWDFGAPGEERDSSAGSIMASGLLELSKYVDAEKGAKYRAFAVRQLLTLASPEYFSEGNEIGHFLLKHGVGHKPNGSEIDTPLDYGDYYFLEALLRFKASVQLPSGRAGAATPREIWLEKMQMVCGKVLKAQAEGTLRQDLPLDPRRVTKEGAQKPNPQSAPFEAFARALIGISAWLELPPSDDAEGRLRAQYLDWAKRGIVNSVDPSSPGYLKFGHEKQSLVECAYISQAAAIAQTRLWAALPQKTQEAFCEELLSNVYKPHDNNWLLFGTLQHLFVLEHGTPAQRERVQPARIIVGLRTFMEKYYKGDGWYGDGKNFHFDNYNSYVIHPMLHDALERIAALPEESRRRLELSDKELARWREEETARFHRYAQVQERLIMADGSYPQFGRSGQYRFGCFQALSYASYLAGRGEFAAPCDPGQVRSALTAVLERQCTGVNFNPQGWMYIGFNGNQPWTSEMYGTPGSVYLCSTIFHVLGLPPDAPFWTAPAKDWTTKSAWAGEKYTRDHALRP